MNKLNEMYPKASEIFLRIKGVFDDGEMEYQVCDTIFGKYVDIKHKDLPIYDEFTYKFITNSGGYCVYRVFI